MRANQKARTRQAIVRAAGALLVDETIDAACREREVPLRLMLAKMLERSIARRPDEPPLRQNRRGPMIEEALAPLAPRLGTERMERLTRALTMIVGTEGFLALTDVARLEAEEAHRVRRWAIDALVAAALSEAYSAG